MENQTSFDLSLAIQRWRENLAKSPAFRSENLNELESHLRDSMAALQTKGLSAEEAFIIAARRMGTCKALEGEFAKVNSAAVWFERALWVLLATQLWSVIRYLSVVGLCAGSWIVRVLNWNQAVSEDPARAVLGVVFSPLGIAVVIGVLWWRFIRRRQWESSLFHKLLQRPLSLTLIFFFSCALFRLIAGYMFREWYAPSFYPEFYHKLEFNPLIGPLLIQLYQYVILAALTYFVARKRLRATAA